MLKRWLALFSFVILLAIIQLQPVTSQNNVPFRVYLTFEDGPTRIYTTEILDTLAQYSAVATFFPNGNQIPGKEDIIQRVIREGHAIGNHMWEEPGYYAGATEEAVREGYFRAEQVVRDALAPTPDLLAIYDSQQKLFRQPGGAAQPFPHTDGVSVFTYNWHVDSNDCGWFVDPELDMSLDEQSLDNVLGTPRALGGARWNVYEHGDGAIIVFHDINRVTGRILPTILGELRSAGATFHLLPRPEDAPGTLPVLLGQPPATASGIPGTQLTGILPDYAYIRTAPNANAELLVVSLAPTTAVTVTGRNGDWYQVTYSGQTGWMYRGTVRILGPVPSLPHIEL